MKNIFTLFTLLLALCATACGGSAGREDSASAGRTESAAPPSGNATAEQVAQEMRGNVRCPARIATPAPPSGASAIDIVGIRPGLTYEEAANLAMCEHPLLVVEEDTDSGFPIQTYGQKVRQSFNVRFAEPRVVKSGRELAQELAEAAMLRGSNTVVQEMAPGKIKYAVGTMGMPGREVVVNAAREEWFAEGKNPTVDSVAQALAGKYGPVTEARDDESSRHLRWAYDPAGRKVSESSPLYSTCHGPEGPGYPVHVGPDCGVVVAARIAWMDSNPGVARSLQVGVVDQANAYRAIKSTEDRLRQEDEARKAKELDDAKQNAKPTL